MTGNILVTLALLVSVFTVIMYYLSLKGYENTIKIARYGYHITAILVLSASLLLFYYILTHQYQFKYIYNYSGSGLPLGLLMSTFYAGQEGSFMLWLLLTALVGIFLLDYTSKRGDLEPRVMAIFTLVVSFLLVMVSPMLKSPFNYIWSEPTFIDVSKINPSFLSLPFLQQHFFSDPNSNSNFVRISKELVSTLQASGIEFSNFVIQGKGLNPLLQNFWMQIHPPILFLGFALSAVPFSFAFAALVKNEYKDWVTQSLPWILTGAMVLGLAIMLGGYWAYGVLGWGGYWGWDPVENSSLVPWIISVAAIHTMLVQKKSQSGGNAPRFVKTNLILAIMTFVLVLYSTFLTRSGILGDASVHSFVDPGMAVYLFLIVLVGAFTLLGFGGIIYRWKYLNETFNSEDNILSRELALFTGSVALIASAIIVTVGTSAPIFGQSVELKFYNDLNLPIAIIIGLLNGLSLFLKWKQTQGNELFKELRLSFALSVISTILIAVFGGITEVMLLLLTFSTAFALFVNIEIAVKIIKGRKSYLGAYIAHAGLAFFFLGVIATGGYSKSEQVDLVKNKTVSVHGYDLTFTGYTPFANGKKYKFNVQVEKSGSKSIAAPVMYIAEFNNSLMREPDIVNMLTKDFYISPISYDTKGGNNNGTSVTLNKDDDYEFKKAKIIFRGFKLPEGAMAKMQSGESLNIETDLDIVYNGNTFTVQPLLGLKAGQQTPIPLTVKEINTEISVVRVNASSGEVTLQLKDLDHADNSASINQEEVLSIEASIKPFINLVWLGVIVMVAGFAMSAYRRTKDANSVAKV